MGQIRSKPAAAAGDEDAEIDEHQVKLICWNVDGLHGDALHRTRAICNIINRLKPDLVLLQEVIPSNQKLLEGGCPKYRLIPGGRAGYYTAVMCRTACVVVHEYHVTGFQDSCQTRNLLSVQATVKGCEVTVMTSHLESPVQGKDNLVERQNQLKQCFQAVLDANESHTVIFGGDFNILYPTEIQDIGGIPKGISDIWEYLGEKEDSEITFDMEANDNVPFGEDKPRRRIDRVYLRHPSSEQIFIPSDLQLIGKDRLGITGQFPSDHWGLYISLDRCDLSDSQTEAEDC